MVTKETSSTLVFPALRLRTLHDAFAPAPAPHQDARVLLPTYGSECDVSKDLTAEIASITEISEEEARLCAQAWRFEQTFEARAEQHFDNQLVENERNVAEEMRQDFAANHAEIESAFEVAAANNVQLVAQGNVAFEQRHRALRQTAFEGSEGHRAHIAWEAQEDVPAYVEASIADGRDLFGMQFGKGDIRVEQQTFATALAEQAYRELLSVEDSIVCWTLCRFLRVTMKSSLRLWLLLEIVDMSNKDCHNSRNLHKSIHSALQHDHRVRFDLITESSDDSAMGNVKCPGISSQFCDGDSWYTFRLRYLWVAPVETICSGMPELDGNNEPMYSTVCLGYFNEIVPRISTCISRPHFASCAFFWVLSGESAWYGKDVLASSMPASLVSHMRKCNSCVKNGQCTAGVISNTSKGTQLPQTRRNVRLWSSCQNLRFGSEM